MARTVGGPPSAKRPGQAVSPAVAALVIVVVLALVVALWLKFTAAPGTRGQRGRAGLFSGKVRMPTAPLTSQQLGAAKKVHEGMLKGMQQATGGRSTPGPQGGAQPGQ
jgi:hypothetical protein